MTRTRTDSTSTVGARFASAARGRPTGSRIVNVEPAPSTVSTRISPPCRDTMPYTMASPSPVPLGPLVEKKGSKIRLRTDSDMPTPVSATVTSTRSPRSRVARRICPPRGSASTALRIRFVRTSRSSEGCPSTGGTAPRSSASWIGTPRDWDSSRHRVRVISTASRIAWFTSTVWVGWSRRTRVNSWIWRTVWAPSSAACSTIASQRWNVGSSSLRWRSCTRPRITARTLLKSCATPEAISPSARSFSMRTSCSWVRRSSSSARRASISWARASS